MSIQWIAKVLDFEHADLDSGMKFVLLGLANHTNPPNQCFPSVGLIMKYTSLSERAVRSNIRKLETEGFITIVRRPQKTSLYYIAIHGADSAPLGADAAPHGADSAPEPLLNHKVTDASDARAFDEDWQPSVATKVQIHAAEGLLAHEIETERKMFILKCQAGTIPDKPDAAFKVWCARRKTLNHKPNAPPAVAPGPAIVWDHAAKLAQLRKTRKLYERMGRSEELITIDQQIAAMEAEDDDTTSPE